MRDGGRVQCQAETGISLDFKVRLGALKLWLAKREKQIQEEERSVSRQLLRQQRRVRQ
jgi:hypothetical protein